VEKKRQGDIDRQEILIKQLKERLKQEEYKLHSMLGVFYQTDLKNKLKNIQDEQRGSAAFRPYHTGKERINLPSKSFGSIQKENIRTESKSLHQHLTENRIAKPLLISDKNKLGPRPTNFIERRIVEAFRLQMQEPAMIKPSQRARPTPLDQNSHKDSDKSEAEKSQPSVQEQPKQKIKEERDVEIPSCRTNNITDVPIKKENVPDNESRLYSLLAEGGPEIKKEPSDEVAIEKIAEEEVGIWNGF